MGVEKWLWTIALKKGVSRAIQLVLAWLVSKGLNNWGVTVDENQLTVAIFAGLEVLRNWLKNKVGVKFI